MSDNKKLVRGGQQHLAALLNNANLQLSISSQLTEDIERRKFVEILKGIDSRQLLRFLSKNVSLDETLILKYKNKWDWIEVEYPDYIHSLPYSEKGYLSTNKYLPWSIQLIEKFEAIWDWKKLSVNSALPWSIELIERFKNKWYWGWDFDQDDLSSNKFLPWSLELIERFEDKWSWWNLSSNKVLPWSLELIERYEDKWHWGDEYIDDFNLSKNESLPWSIELIERFENKWDWVCLSKNEALPWSIELIERFANNRWSWCWQRLSSNKGLPWSIELIERFEKKWDWGWLSENKALPRSLELIERVIKRVNFENKQYRLLSLLDNAISVLPKLSSQDIEEVMSFHFL